jgi:anti-sigma regulatory factor (Ser/Thr protein kinase)
VVVHVTGDVVEVSVLAHGPDLPAQPPPDADTDAPGVRGRGLWLLRRLVDEVRLERVRLGTRVTLRREIGPPRTLAR